MRAALARHAGVSATDLDALEHLEADGPLTQRDLGERLSITSGAVTMLVDRLEAAGWVVRQPHPSDRRYILIELSAQAAEQTPAGLATYHSSIRALVAEVPSAASPRHCHVPPVGGRGSERGSPGPPPWPRRGWPA